MSLLVGSTVCVTALPDGEHRSLTRRMSASGLTAEAQLQYILQWFGEFSELQREDFVPVLAAVKTGNPDHLAASLALLSCQDKPASLFQCRIKLFNEWYPTWAEEEQDRLVKGVTEMDPEFGLKLQDLLTNGPKTNGELNGFGESYSPDAEEHKDDTEAKENVEQRMEVVSKEEEEGEEYIPDDEIPDENAEHSVPAVTHDVLVEITAAS